MSISASPIPMDSSKGNLKAIQLRLAVLDDILTKLVSACLYL